MLPCLWYIMLYILICILAMTEITSISVSRKDTPWQVNHDL